MEDGCGRVPNEEGGIVVPLYIQCPHCEHPRVITANRRGKALYCRQCGEAYKTFQSVDVVRPVRPSFLFDSRSNGSEVSNGNAVLVEV